MTNSKPIIPWLQRWFPRVRLPMTRDAQRVVEVRKLATQVRFDSDAELQRRVNDLREMVACGSELLDDAVLIPAFACVAEAARRAVGVELFSEQLLAGCALAHRAIAEMQTGEGKTFATALPAVLRSLTGRGVHVMTVNAYLAERDFHELKPIFETLGITVGLLQPQAAPADRRTAYDADVTYGPGYEFGFDYLRDQLILLRNSRRQLGNRWLDASHAPSPTERPTVQRGLECAIVDEADSVLIDEAITPLVIAVANSAEGDVAAELFRQARQMASVMIPGRDFVVHFGGAATTLTNAGARRLDEAIRALPAPLVSLARPWRQYVEQALAARHCLHRDIHYVVREGRVQLVDQFTGRIFSDRNWQDGLHQAVEAKEEVKITAEPHSMARIARQRFFRLYDELCGLTGTAASATRELMNTYRLSVIEIPLRRRSQRNVCSSRCFATVDQKWEAIVVDVRRRHAIGQPVLIGTRTISQSNELAERFRAAGIDAQLLNGVQTAEEAAIIAQAGTAGMITIATNMAGRGTDIRLAPHIAEIGGLHVIGTEHHESARIDRQLFGRCARQGDPGSCQMFLSAEDELLRTMAPRFSQRLPRFADGWGEIVLDVSYQFTTCQRQAERAAHALRQQLTDTDDRRTELVSRL